jgi:hypothetical protein
MPPLFIRSPSGGCEQPSTTGWDSGQARASSRLELEKNTALASRLGVQPWNLFARNCSGSAFSQLSSWRSFDAFAGSCNPIERER